MAKPFNMRSCTVMVMVAEPAPTDSNWMFKSCATRSLASMAWLTASASCWGLSDESDEDDDEEEVDITKDPGGSEDGDDDDDDDDDMEDIADDDDDDDEE